MLFQTPEQINSTKAVLIVVNAHTYIFSIHTCRLQGILAVVDGGWDFQTTMYYWTM